MSDWLLDTLLATSALALLVLLVREPVRKRFGSRVTYGLWLIPAARLFMPTLTHTVERIVPAAAPLQPLAQPLASEHLWMARVTPADPSLFDRLDGWPTVLIAVWLVVGTALFVSRIIAYRRDRRAILASSLEAEHIGSVRVIRSAEVASPLALGILDRIIAVPMDFERLYDIHERRLVLEHELAHHRSGDLVANLFAFVLLCLQWFNPLAWVAHAAFRFDQEAACDARVLDKVTADDRADYGRAIAKAASGRALLFASALDRRNTLKRRLHSMLKSSNPTQRLAGRLLVATAIAAALPLTASRAVDYVDIAAPQPTAAIVHAAAPTPVLAASASQAANPSMRTEVHPAVSAGLAPAASTLNVDDNLTISGDLITIDGKTKRWEELTPAEKARVRSAVAKARASLANTHLDEAKIMRDVASIPDGTQLQRQLARSQAEISESVRRMDEKAAQARAAGREPDQLEAAIRATLQSVQAIDLQNAANALANVDRQKIASSVAGAQQSMEKAKTELARLQARMDADQHP